MLNVSTTLCDELRITFRSASGISIETQPVDPLLGQPAENSVVRAWGAFWEEFSSNGPPCGASVALTKRIPIGGGLGGGSSDAAAMLRLLVSEFGVQLCEQGGLTPGDFDIRVMRVALRVGADVPYAYRSGVCWVTGIGEWVQTLDWPAQHFGEVLVAMPRVAVPTVDFYRFFRERHPIVPLGEDAAMERVAREGLRRDELFALIENDFERDVVAFRPAVGEVLGLARRYFPRTTSVTGSGAAIFSVVPQEHEASIPAYRACLESNGVTVHRARLVTTSVQGLE